MRLFSLSSLAGLKRLSVASGILLLSMQLPATAETITTVNGLPIDSQVFDFYVQSRTQRTADQLSPEERDTLLQELKDVYLLATQSQADEVRNDPQIVAQLELQKTSLIAQTVATLYITSMEITDDTRRWVEGFRVVLEPEKRRRRLQQPIPTGTPRLHFYRIVGPSGAGKSTTSGRFRPPFSAVSATM